MSTEHELETVREKEFEEEEEIRRVLPWKKQITLRGVVASVVIGSIFNVIAMKLNLTTGITPNLNVSVALVAFVFLRTWSKALAKFEVVSSPSTQQENIMIKTCVVACYSISVGGGFRSYLLGMNKKTFELSGALSVVGNSPDSIKEPGIGWMIVFLFLVCFISLFVLIPLRKPSTGGDYRSSSQAPATAAGNEPLAASHPPKQVTLYIALNRKPPSIVSSPPSIVSSPPLMPLDT